MEDYVHEYYSVHRFVAAYEGVIKPMTDKAQWPMVDVGFKLQPPKLNRLAGRPRKQRIKGSDEVLRKKHKCKRCKQYGHQARKCKEPMADGEARPTPPIRRKRKRGANNPNISQQADPSVRVGPCSASLSGHTILN